MSRDISKVCIKDGCSNKSYYSVTLKRLGTIYKKIGICKKHLRIYKESMWTVSNIKIINECSGNCGRLCKKCMENPRDCLSF